LSHKNSALLRQVKERGLKDVWLFVSGKLLALVERLGEFYANPAAQASTLVVALERRLNLL